MVLRHSGQLLRRQAPCPCVLEQHISRANPVQRRDLLPGKRLARLQRRSFSQQCAHERYTSGILRSYRARRAQDQQ
jgi:hypothetical protein